MPFDGPTCSEAVQKEEPRQFVDLSSARDHKLSNNFQVHDPFPIYPEPLLSSLRHQRNLILPPHRANLIRQALK